jgi:hypothetical protein
LCVSQRLLETSTNVATDRSALFFKKAAKLVRRLTIDVKLLWRHIGPQCAILEDIAFDCTGNRTRAEFKTVLEIAVEASAREIRGTDDGDIVVGYIDLRVNAWEVPNGGSRRTVSEFPQRARIRGPLTDVSRRQIGDERN